MFRFIEQILDGFRPCFSRRAAFRWFVVVIVGLMLRSDRLGVTSIIRDLALDPSGYESLIHFFRSTAWDAGKIRDKWYRILVSKAPLLRIHGRVVLIGDGVKQSKEGYFIPGVKKMVQESEDSSKPQYIFGHMFGAVGVLAGTLERHFCLPLKINIQEGLRSASLWDNSGISPESHIIQMIESAFETADVFGRSILLLDRYFLTTSALRKQAELNAVYGSPDHVTIVTKAKSNYVAYRKPAPKAPGAKGRPRLKGDTVKLSELLNDDSRYRKAQALLYGRRKEISYFYEDLLWGQKLYQEMRFVFVKYDGMKSIFVCTDLTIDPVRIAELYGFRFNIERCFREFKQQLGGFCYHFWTKHMPRLNHYAKKGNRDPLARVADKEDQKAILDTVKAIEGFVLFSSIAMGILQMLSLMVTDNRFHGGRYLRTQPENGDSEATVMSYMRRNIFLMFLKYPDSFVTRFIREKQTGKSGNIRDGVA